jgi:hypothetical protein
MPYCVIVRSNLGKVARVNRLRIMRGDVRVNPLVTFAGK